ncbi:hypothetical protein [Rhizobium leguminosarum]|uniref:hypothetical protein n=1 Tax=Rhizobium TaxID=379 RepID=UPI0013EEBC9A|nr:hypothetical protein [Rhizobium leguminosarum]
MAVHPASQDLGRNMFRDHHVCRIPDRPTIPQNQIGGEGPLVSQLSEKLLGDHINSLLNGSLLASRPDAEFLKFTPKQLNFGRKRNMYFLPLEKAEHSTSRASWKRSPPLVSEC